MNPSRRILALVLLAGVFVMDGYDLNAMPLAIPHLAGPLGLNAAGFGVVITATMLGLGAGAALLAPLGDRLGRRTLIVAGCLAVALATWATAHSTSITGFLIWRFLTGAGLGACLPNCTALSAELATEKSRATVMSVVSAGIALGAFAAGFSAPEVVAAAGWQGLFYLPTIFAALLGAVLWFVLPGGAPGHQAHTGTGVAAPKLPQLQLFSAPWRFPFAVFAGALTLNATNLYLLTSWIPTILPNAGFSVSDAARISGLMQLAGLGFGIAMSVLIDRWRPGLTLIGGFTAMTLCFAAIGLTAPDPASWTVLLLAGVGLISGAGMALPALTAYLFPAHMLSSAMGLGVLVARVGALAGPLIGSAMLTANVEPRLFLATAVVPATLAALICLAIPAALAVKRRVDAEAEETIA